MHLHTHISIYTYSYIYIYIYIYIYAYIHSYIHIHWYTYTYIYIYTYFCGAMWCSKFLWTCIDTFKARAQVRRAPAASAAWLGMGYVKRTLSMPRERKRESGMCDQNVLAQNLLHVDIEQTSTYRHMYVYIYIYMTNDECCAFKSYK